MAILKKENEKVRDFYQVIGELSEVDGSVVRGNRILIPTSMRKDKVEMIHDGHQGLVKFSERANQSFGGQEFHETHNKSNSVQVLQREQKHREERAINA